MFRFTIRDVLWLTVVVGLAFGWRVDYRNMRAENRELRGELEQARLIEALHALAAPQQAQPQNDAAAPSSAAAK